MGADTFCCNAQGKTAQEAFSYAVESAQYQNGHGGYTGTIAEKSSFKMFQLPKDKKLSDYIEELTDTVLEDKWGPAGCIEVKPGEFVFFGWASC
jgi:hypothetical protein